MTISAVLIGFFTVLCKVVLADITGTNPPLGSCLCFSGSTVNVRGSACGSVIGSAVLGECFRYKGTKQSCSLGGTSYEFFNIDFTGGDGWSAGNYMVNGNDQDCGGQPPVGPNTEFRSTWVSTVFNIDWPSRSGLSTAEQQRQLREYLDIMSDLNMNCLILQVRPAGDAFYDSSLEPWSRWLTGTQGIPPIPFWDPLQFAINEAASRNIEVHAWLNPYRASVRPDWNGLDPLHMANRFRQYAYPYGRNLWMDPGAEDVQNHIYNVVMDITRRYNVDGIHIDDYFYPYPSGSTPFPDDATYAAYLLEGGSMSLADWRRDNVNRMIRRVYEGIKSIKRHVKFGVSPFGIYRPGQPGGMPNPIRGLDQYSRIYADPKLWLQNGWLDYLSPQLYWAITPPAQSYPTLLNWWCDVNTGNRHIYAGNGCYKMRDSNNWPASEIVAQIEISRLLQDRLSLGNVLFSAKDLRDNTKGIRDDLEDDVYNTRVSIPPMPWLQSSKTNAPQEVKTDGNSLSWKKAESSDIAKWNVYQQKGGSLILHKVLSRDEVSVEVKSGVYAIAAVSKASVESERVFIVVSEKQKLG